MADSSLIGEVLGGTYCLERLLAEGGMGAVYEATHRRLARRFAVKLLYARIARDEAAIQRFQREAEITSALGHPHIVDVVDFNHADDGTPYIVMELLRGEDLAARLARSGPLSLQQALSIFGQTASALEAAHRQGVVHRDLKPSNIFLCKTEETDHFVKVVDFGMSKVLGHRSQMTQAGALIGTPFYMSPEQAEQRPQDIDLRTDIYALGVIFYEMLSGTSPFADESSNVPALLYKIVHQDPPPLGSSRPELPAQLIRVIARAMSKRREQRFATVSAFAQALQAAAQHAAGGALEPQLTQPMWSGALPDLPTVPNLPAPDTAELEPTTERPAPPAPDPDGWSDPLLSPPSIEETSPPLMRAGLTTGPPAPETAETSVRQLLHRPGTLSGSSGQLRRTHEDEGGQIWLAIAAIAIIVLGAVGLWWTGRSPQDTAGADRPVRGIPAAARPASPGHPTTPPAHPAIAGPRTKRPASAQPTAERQRRLWIASDPSGATVLLDGERIGETPLLGVAIPRRQVVVMLRKVGHADHPIVLDRGTADQRLPLLRLTPLAPPPERRQASRRRAWLKVRAVYADAPVAAEVYVDGKPAGRTGERLAVRPGRRAIEVRHPELGTRRIRRRTRRGRVTRVTLRY